MSWEEARERYGALGIDAEIGFLDRAFDRAAEGGVPGLDHEDARLGNGDGRDLVDRGLGSVVIDGDLIEDFRVRSSGADGREFRFHDVQGFLHFFVSVCNYGFHSQHTFLL